MLDALPARPHKGRGAVTNRSGRYEALERVRVDDGWPGLEEERDPWLETTVLPDASRSIIAHNESPDVPFDRSINPYRGCEHGCVYCFARPTHAWLGLSAGLDFETKLFAKHEAAKLLQAAFAKASYQPDVIALGTSTDPYQPIERELRITRQILEVMARCRHPVAIVTKSNLVLRDLDILAPMAERRLVKVMVSVTTLDRELARRLEPRAPTPALRLEAIRRLSEAGVPTGVLAAPMIPALNDSEMEAILAAAADAGADTAGYVLLRLPLEIKGLFEEWLETHVPDRKARILKLIRETRGGRLYDPTFGRRMKGQGLYADLLKQRFRLACKRRGLDRRDWAFDLNLFRRPAADPNQLPLL